MTSRFLHILTVLLIALLFISACSRSDSGSQSPLTPSIDNQNAMQTAGPKEPNHYLWGYYLAYADPAANKIVMVPDRSVATHWNTIKWLEQGPCTSCVQVTKIIDGGSGSKNVDVKITHPFSNKNFTGFDVRGIALFDAGITFPTSGLTIPDHSAGNGELGGYLDGFTTLYSATTAGSGPNGLQGYKKGKFASGKAPAATLNGFKNYITNDPANTRNAFYAGTSIKKTYAIWMPKNPFVFGYAVDACWANPSKKPVTDPMVDFPPEANCSEPWKIDLYTLNPQDLTDHGGSMLMEISVYDHQGKDSHYAPKVECPDLFDGTLDATWADDQPDYTIYNVEIENPKLAPSGQHRLMVSVEDKDNATSPDYLDLTAYMIDYVDVSQSQGWARTWGSLDEDWGQCVATDSYGNVYVAGKYYGDMFSYIDFDPTSGTDFKTSQGKFDCFLEKFTKDGSYAWAQVWGGSEDDAVLGIATWNDTIYVTGFFSDVVDFNPSPDGALNRASAGGHDGFVSAFQSSGNFLWVDTWGGDLHDEGHAVAANSLGFAMVTGFFMGDCDFDSSSGQAVHSTGIFNTAGFVSEYSMIGFWHWTKSWGEGSSNNGVNPQGIAIGSSDDMYITGSFTGLTDIAPGPDTDNRGSKGKEDAFMLMTDKAGVKYFADTWGGIESDSGTGIAVDSGRNIYVSGMFQDVVDFHPGPTVENHTSNGGYDAFVTKWIYSGGYSTITWGGPETDRAMSIAVAQDIGSIYVGGDFMGTVDLDPGSGSDSHISNGFSDTYVSRFNFDGSFEWARTFGGDDWDAGLGVAADNLDAAIFTGCYRNTANFDPTGGTDEHTSNGNLDIFVEKILFDATW